MKNKMLFGYLKIILSSSLFGLMPFFTKIAYAHGATPITAAFFRCFFAVIILAIMLKAMRKSIFAVKKALLLPVLKIALPFGLIPVALFISYTYLDSGMATILFYTHPVFVMLLTIFMYHRFPSGYQILCMILCLIGIVLLNSIGGNINIIGILIAISAGLIYSIYIIACGQKGIEEIDPTVLSFWLNFLGMIEIGLIGLFSNQLLFSIDPTGYTVLLVLSLLVSVFAVMLFQYGVLVTGGLKASLLSTFEPLTGIFIGVFIFREVLTARQLLGIVFVLVSVCLLLIPQKKQGL